MVTLKKLFSEILKFWHQIFWGTDNFPSIFSFNGVLNRSLAWATALIIYFVLECISWLELPLITYLFGLFSFYCILALVQKRCRDFGSKGTLWILFITIVMLSQSIIYYTEILENRSLSESIHQTARILYCIVAVILFIPSKPNVDMELNSPLLRYPLLYSVICWILAISLALTINHYSLLQ